MGKRSTAVAIEQTVLEDFCVESNVRGVYRSCCGVFGVFGGVVRASDRGVHAGGDGVYGDGDFTEEGTLAGVGEFDARYFGWDGNCGCRADVSRERVGASFGEHGRQSNEELFTRVVVEQRRNVVGRRRKRWIRPIRKTRLVKLFEMDEFNVCVHVASRFG